MFNRILRFNFFQGNTDAALLAFRIGAFGTLFLKHGYEKIFQFSQHANVAADPIHIGHIPSLIIALVGDGICSLFIVIGLGTRLAALYEFSTVFTAWALWHHFAFFGHNNAVAGHGELIVMYLISLITIIIAGPGRYSVDARLKKDYVVSHRLPDPQILEAH